MPVIRFSDALKPLLVLTCAMILSGCKVGPNYKTPEIAVPESYSESLPSTTQPATTQAATTQPATLPAGALAHWWTTFNDPMLDALTRQAVEANLNLRVAAARIRAARAQRGIISSGLYPNVNVDGAYTHQKLSSNAIQQAPQSQYDLWQAGFDASWEIDVFGGVARAVEAADADIQSSIEARRDTLVTLMAEVARNYIELRGAQRQLVITENNLRSQRDTLSLTEQRFNAGLTSELDVDRQRAQVDSTSSEIPNLQTTIRVAIHALGVLTGKSPGALSAMLTPQGPLPQAPQTLPVGLPSELLRRRPDIRQAERQLAAATARIGQATADLFPKFSLTGSFGQSSQSFHQLFDASSNFWLISPAISWPLFDAGRIRSNIKLQDANTEEALASYQQIILTSLQEVDDALIAYGNEQTRRISLAGAVEANRRSVDLSNQLYSRGLIDFLSVLDAQRNLLVSELALVQSDTSVSSNLVALYKALGGGWDESMEAAPETKK